MSATDAAVDCAGPAKDAQKLMMVLTTHIFPRWASRPSTFGVGYFGDASADPSTLTATMDSTFQAMDDLKTNLTTLCLSIHAMLDTGAAVLPYEMITGTWRVVGGDRCERSTYRSLPPPLQAIRPRRCRRPHSTSTCFSATYSLTPSPPSTASSRHLLCVINATAPSHQLPWSAHLRSSGTGHRAFCAT